MLSTIFSNNESLPTCTVNLSPSKQTNPSKQAYTHYELVQQTEKSLNASTTLSTSRYFATKLKRLDKTKYFSLLIIFYKKHEKEFRIIWNIYRIDLNEELWFGRNNNKEIRERKYLYLLFKTDERQAITSLSTSRI